MYLNHLKKLKYINFKNIVWKGFKEGRAAGISAEKRKRINRLKKRQLTRIAIASSLTDLLIAITSYLFTVQL